MSAMLLKICFTDFLNTSKYASNFKFSYYHLLNMWLLGATSDNYGYKIMDLSSPKTFIVRKWL